MKPLKTHAFALLTLMLLTAGTAMAQKGSKSTNQNDNAAMKTWLIEREVPGAGDLTPEQLKGISQTSCNVLSEMGPKIQWIHSYVTGNKIYCIYKAESEELIREHAKKGGFPANSIVEIKTKISPATAE